MLPATCIHMHKSNATAAAVRYAIPACCYMLMLIHDCCYCCTTARYTYCCSKQALYRTKKKSKYILLYLPAFESL